MRSLPHGDPQNATTLDLAGSESSAADPASFSVAGSDDRVDYGPTDLIREYEALLGQRQLAWSERHQMLRRLGSGGQGVVYLCERIGADQFRLPVAVKIFSPQNFVLSEDYEASVARMAQVAMRVAMIQQDNLIDVHNFISHNGVRLMEMEWIDGFDLSRLLDRQILAKTRERVSPERWDYLNDVIITAGPEQPRLKPGVAIAVLRDCLAALSPLHREGIVHGDIKPSNIMLKKTGNAKLIDIGSAYEWQKASHARTCTPAYAAPEVLEGQGGTPQSDLASLGYVLVEMLAGVSPFAGMTQRDALLRAKYELVDRLASLLPEDVVINELLMSLIRGLIAPNPQYRFPSAEAADFVEKGAANFHRQLVLMNLASDYENEIRVWLEEIETP